jgi:hypothetical protein
MLPEDVKVKYCVKHVDDARRARQTTEKIYKGVDIFIIDMNCTIAATHDPDTIRRYHREIKAVCPDAPIFLRESASNGYTVKDRTPPLPTKEAALELAASLGMEYITTDNDAWREDFLPRVARAVFKQKQDRGESIGGCCMLC